MIKENKKTMGKKRIETNSSTYKIFGLLIISILSIIAIIPNVMAHCPLCTAGTIIGVGITRSLGWDDSIIGIFVGAMIVSSALWFNNVLKKKNVGGNKLLRVSSIILATFVLTILSFYFAGIFGPANTYRIFGIEKIIFGSISGAIVSFAAFFISNEIKRKNDGKTRFSCQTMVLTFGALILNAIIFWMVFQ